MFIASFYRRVSINLTQPFLRLYVENEGRKTGGSDKLNLDISNIRRTFDDFRTEVGGGQTHPITVFLAEHPVPPVTVKSIALEESANLLLRYKDVERQLDSIESDSSLYFVKDEIPTSTVSSIRTLLRDNRNLLVSVMNKCKAASEKSAKSVCDLSRVSLAYPPAVNQLAKLYKSTCSGIFTPPPLDDGTFVALPRVSGDSSMGGQDVAAATIQYSGVAGGFVKRNIKLRIVETRPNYTQYAKESESVVWSESLYPGCAVGSSFALPVEDVGSGFPLMGDGGTAVNDYMTLPFNSSKYLVSATCRSNQQGSDDGFVGCKAFVFKPIQIDLRHAESKNGGPPELSVPAWLSNPSASKSNFLELRGLQGL
ncbi:hypothetical protein PQR64_37925 [Paraburkholderia phytofirmans]|uniref:hypothetical protein n=1 Tax=Paraburkholderia phytofirmans TaxID=261302 RepID=UPI0038B88A1C